MRKTILTLMLLAGMMTEAAAQMPAGFKDFNVAPAIASSTPYYLVEFDGKLYFYANNASSGRELHSVLGDGVPILIDNVSPASNSCIGVNFSNPAAGMNGKFYFTAENGSTGEEMYVYDGSTVKLQFDHDFGPDSSKPDHYFVTNNVLYYSVITQAEGRELWSFSGTGAPARITDVNPGTGDGVSGPFALLKGILYFIGNDGINGTELWSYNPATTTTAMVANIATGGGSSNPANLTVLNGKMYFSATTFTHGRELYEFDGTNPPARVSDISPDALSSLSPADRSAFAWFDDKVFFAAKGISGENHLYTYDPATNTVNLDQKINANGDSGPRELVIYNNRLFFTANDGSSGYELFAYDGINAPVLIGDLCPGSNSSIPTWLTPIGDELYFTANNCTTSGIDLFSYNYMRVGIQNVLFDGDIEVYPNPVADELNIRLSLKQGDQLHVQLVDMLGKTVYDHGTQAYSTGSNHINISMANLQAGNYIYTIKNNQGTTYATGKVVKQ